jgi:hypothetical protein
MRYSFVSLLSDSGAIHQPDRPPGGPQQRGEELGVVAERQQRVVAEGVLVLCTR